MEQSILTEENRRWINAVVKLTTLTYSGKLRWTKRLADTVPTPADFFSETRFMPLRYNAEIDGRRFLLMVNKPTITAQSSWGDLLGMPGFQSRQRVSLQAFDKDGAKVLDVPNLTVLQALADAVESKTDSAEEDVLSAIEGADV